jgi:hypothetical protein
MADGHSLGAHRFSRLGEKGVADFARCLFKGNPALGPVCPYVAGFHSHGQAQSGCQLPDVVRIGLRFLSAKLVVQVRHVKVQAFLEVGKNMQKANRIGAAGDGNQEAVHSYQQSVPLNELESPRLNRSVPYVHANCPSAAVIGLQAQAWCDG